jgi:hypothetical protein
MTAGRIDLLDQLYIAGLPLKAFARFHSPFDPQWVSHTPGRMFANESGLREALHHRPMVA